MFRKQSYLCDLREDEPARSQAVGSSWRRARRQKSVRNHARTQRRVSLQQSCWRALLPQIEGALQRARNERGERSWAQVHPLVSLYKKTSRVEVPRDLAAASEASAKFHRQLGEATERISTRSKAQRMRRARAEPADAATPKPRRPDQIQGPKIL